MNQSRTEPYLNDPDHRPPPSPGSDGSGRRRRRRSRLVAILLVLIVLLGIAAVVSMLWQPGRRPVTADAERTPPATAPSAPPSVQPPEEPRYPIAAPGVAQPPLDMSDTTLVAGLSTAFGDGSLSAYLVPTNLVRSIVVTVDNIPRRTSASKHWPVKPAAGSLVTATDDGRITIADANKFRYSPYVRLLESLNTEQLVELYKRHYPLFQQAYRELGYPQGNFNDRAVQAIDTLMATPTLEQPLRLAQPKIFYEFADRDLESLPSGQKLMLRIGSENAARVKAKLSEIRAAITDPALAQKR